MAIDKEKILEAKDLIGLATALVAPERENVSQQQLHAGLRVMLKNVHDILASLIDAEEVAPAVTITRKEPTKKIALIEDEDLNNVVLQKAELEIIELDEDIFLEDEVPAFVSEVAKVEIAQAPIKTVQSAVEVVKESPKKGAPLIARKAVQVSSTKLGGKLF